jgi:acyl carrier protein
VDGALEIKTYITAQFAPDVTVDQLDADFDLLENGVVDSLGLLRLIEWVGNKYSLPVEEMDLAPANFRSVNAICDFVTEARGATR